MIRYAFLVLAMMAAPALAQVNPKPGDDDGAAASAPCPVISGQFRFCGSSPEFVLTPQQDNEEVTSYYTTPQGFQVAAIIEPLGSADGLSVEGLQGAALEILSNASGEPVSSIPILERTTLIVDGVPRPNFVYRGRIGGLDYLYSNTIVLLDNEVAQFVTISVGDMVMTPSHRDVHMRYLALLQVGR